MTVAAQFVGGVFKPLGPVALTEGDIVDLDFKPKTCSNINDVLDQISGMISKDTPADGSINHDHYLYGARRRDLP